MNLIVCMKQVPSSNEVRMDPKTKTIIRDAKSAVWNPFDRSALEVAVLLKEQLGGHITALSMGIPDTSRLLEEAISCGADEALLLSDRAFAGADTLATSYALSLGVKEIGPYHLILCGKMAVDGDTAQIGPELAETLGIPHITDVTQIVFASEKELIVSRKIDGASQLVQVALPALLTVVKEIAQPRLPSIASILHAKETPCTVRNAQNLQADTTRTGLLGSPTQVVKTFTPPPKQSGVTLSAKPDQAAKEIAALFEEVKR